MISSDIRVTPQAESAAAAPSQSPDRGAFSFHSVLSAMNPLQYLPVVGSVYRALTGDVIPEAVRQGGSMLVSGLLGGPIGLITNIGVTLAEKLTGIDPEKIAAAAFHTAAPAAAAPARKATPPAAVVAPASPPAALSATQLAGYGVQSATSGTLKLGDVEGADVLNTVELIRLGKAAAAAYAANQPLPSVIGGKVG